MTLIFLLAEDLGSPVRPVLCSLLQLLLNIPVQQTWLPEIVSGNYYITEQKLFKTYMAVQILVIQPDLNLGVVKTLNLLESDGYLVS